LFTLRMSARECVHVLGCDCGTELAEERDEVVQSRLPTDFPCCLAFVICVASLFIVYDVALNNGGDANLVLWANDWELNKCDNYGAWPDVRFMEVKICVDSCDQTMNSSLVVTPLTASSTTAGYESVEVYGYCIPETFYIGYDTEINISNNIYEIWSAKWMVVMCIGVTILLCALYLCALNVMAVCIIYLLMFCFILGGLAGTVILIYLSYEETYNDDMAWGLFIGGILLGILTLCFIAFCCWFQKNLAIAVEVMDQAGDALFQLCWLTVAGIFEIVFILVFCGLWLYFSLFLFSMDHSEVTKTMPTNTYDTCSACGSLDSLLGSTYEKYNWNPTFDGYAVYMLFILFFVVEFLKYFWYLWVSCAFAEWYFSLWAEDDGDDWKERGSRPDQLSHWPVTQAFFRTFIYHMGTIAFAAFILAVVETIQAVFMWIHRRVFESGNPLAKCIACTIACVLKCLECCVRYMGKIALNYCAIFGTPFCPSSSRALTLVTKNIVVVAAINVVNRYVTFLGRWGITIGAANISFFVLAVSTSTVSLDMSNYALVALWVLMLFLSYVISSVVLGIYDIGVDQIMMCFLVDLQVNKPENMFASNDLLSAVKESRTQSKRTAKKYKRQLKALQMDENTKDRDEEVELENKEINFKQQRQ